VEWKFSENKPVIISEFGGECVYGLRGEKTDRFTEDYQEDMYIRSVNMFKRIPGLAGTTPWILKDFRSPRRQLPGLQDDFNRKGLVSDKGQKKKAFYVMQKWYNELKK
jgi:beta-glucuronidase